MNETGDSVAEMTQAHRNASASECKRIGMQAHRNAGASKYAAGGPPYLPVRMEAWDRQR